MHCPRCTVAEIPDGATDCPLCGYSTDKSPQVTVLAPDELDERVRSELGLEFQIESEIWRSNESRTYLATNVSGLPVTLTVATRSAGGEGGQPARVHRAAQLARTLDHPHIVPTIAAGTSASLLWWASKLLEARPLGDQLRELGPLALDPCRRIIEQVASALDHAHRQGIAHGDVSDRNVLVDANGWAFVGQFGFGVAVRGISVTRQGGPSGDQRSLGTLVARCLNLPADSAAIPAPVMHAIQRAVSPDSTARFPTVLDFVAAFSGNAAVPAVQANLQGPTPTKKRRSGPRVFYPDREGVLRRGWKWIGLLLVAAGAVVAGLVLPFRMPWVGVPIPADLASEISRHAAPPVAVPPVETPAPKPAAGPADAARLLRPVPRVVPAAPAPAPVANGQLSVNSTPWGQVYVDGVLLGNTPQMGVVIRAGPHVVRVVRDGFQPLERQIVVGAGDQVRLTDLVLPPR